MANKSPACDLSSHTSGRYLTPTCSLSDKRVSARTAEASSVHTTTPVQNFIEIETTCPSWMVVRTKPSWCERVSVKVQASVRHARIPIDRLDQHRAPNFAFAIVNNSWQYSLTDECIFRTCKSIQS